MKVVCIHGHFYQPPRENPWLEAIEPQDSATPYHDWNERVSAECYAPNAASRILDDDGRIVDIMNNYARISFNFGPTLLAWMEKRASTVYRAVLRADAESQNRFGGHGSAIAQVYNHTILPLATETEKEIQVRWGLRDFERRFGRGPEGMWLAETAVDTPTLEALARHAIRFTILAPSQAKRFRRVGAKEWTDVSSGTIDPSRAYRMRLPSGRDIALFFYDGPAARAVAFEGILHHGGKLADRLLGLFTERDEAQLAHIATDGESYGHHHRHGDMALAFALRSIEERADVELTNYGQFLERCPPAYEVEILEETSWSCAHGIERWRSDCGCRTGGNEAWNQRFRAPLRRALDGLRDALEPRVTAALDALVHAGPPAVFDYIDVVVDRSPSSVARFLQSHAQPNLGPKDRVRLFELLEVERQLQLMYTSCGWFFNDLGGIETLQVLRYAGHALQLAESLFGESFETGFLDELALARSNRPELGTGRDLYEKHVKSSRVTWDKLAAHYCIDSLFEPRPARSELYCYDVDREELETRRSGKMTLLFGTARLTSRVTGDGVRLSFSGLHLGDHTVAAGVRPAGGSTRWQEALAEPFGHADAAGVLRAIDRHFGPETYDLRSLFSDEQRRIVDSLLRSTLEEAEAIHRQLYEHHWATMRFLAELGVPPPRALSAAAEIVLNRRLRDALSDSASESEVESLIAEASSEGVDLDEPALAFAARESLLELSESFFAEADDLQTLKRLRQKVRAALALPFDVELSALQDRYFRAIVPVVEGELGAGNEPSWLEEFRALGEDLGIDPGRWLE